MANDVENGKACAALAYLFPIGLIWYLVDANMKKNKFAAFHVYQSLAYAIVVFVLYIAATILTLVSLGLLSVLWFVVWILSLVWFVQGLVNALTGKQNKLFLIGSIGDKFSF
ncbi:TPA: DUF4870 domain-containing protein [Candidatus Woesearchaeota archaeon]|nr:DUF4870 domain-containing protein [Candidatus Woesearchaeota archaeon]